MEVRALVAVILSLVILIGFSYFEIKYLRPKQIPQLQEETTTKKQSAAESRDIFKKTPGKEISLPAGLSEIKEKNGAREEEIVVENRLYKAVLTNRGGKIKEFYVKKYLDAQKNPLNMIPEGDNASLPLTLIFREDEYGKTFDGAVYAMSVGDRYIQLGSLYPEVEVAFVYSNKSLIIRKALTFHDDKYAIDVKIDVEKLENRSVVVPYKVVWGPGLFSDLASDSEKSTQISTSLNGKITNIKLEKLDKPLEYKGKIEWTAIHNKFFAAVFLMSSQEADVTAFHDNRGGVLLGLDHSNKEVPGTDSFSLYIGPKESERLKTYNMGLNKLIDYGYFGFLVEPLQKLLHWFYKYTGNYGIAIIFLTVLIKIIFFPLTHKSFKSMQGMQKIQPKMKVIQEKFKNDRVRMNQEMMRIYRENKINPMGGCLPMVLQIPVFIALYQLLLNSIDLRMSPFFWWITDLSSKDPYYITPLIMGASMFIQQKMTPAVGDPKMAKMMLFMPVIFTVMFLQFPVGLVIYWLVNNILTIGQQMIINRMGVVEQLKKKPEIIRESK